MTLNNLLTNAELSADPFRIVPPDDFDDLIWAGDKSVYLDLMEACKSPRPDEARTTEFVILWGDLGSGKTHNLKYAAKELRDEGQLVAYLVRPNVTGNTRWKDIVQDIIDQFGRQELLTRFDLLRRHILTKADRQAVEAMGGAVDPDRLDSLKAEKEQLVHSEILPASPGFVDFIMDFTNPNDTSKRDECWTYLTSDLPATRAQNIAGRYGIPTTGMSTDHDASQLFYYLIKLLTYQTDMGVGTDVVYLFIDECENIAEISPAGRQSIQQGLRDLVNYSTDHTFVGLAFTISDASDLYGHLDEPVLSRVSRDYIRVPQIDEAAGKSFLLEELAYFRFQDSTKPPEWPFTPDGLDAFVANCPGPLTFRRLNRSARNLIFSKYKQKVLDGLGVDASDVADFRGWGV